MKKILWLIFLNIVLINFVSAKVYYSDYSDFSEFQEKEIVASDTIDVIKEERYLWYRDKKQDRGAGTTKLREPTGKDRRGSNLAEFRRQVWRRDGGRENISVTVCEGYFAVALSTNCHRDICVSR